MKGRHGCGDGCGIIVASRPRWRVVIGLGHELGQLCQQPGKDRDKGGDRGQGDKDDRHSDDRDRHALAVNDALDSYVEFRHKKLKMRYQSADASPSGSGRPERPSLAIGEPCQPVSPRRLLLWGFPAPLTVGLGRADTQGRGPVPTAMTDDGGGDQTRILPRR